MDQSRFETLLASLPLGQVRYYDSLPSTNDAAAACLQAGCLDSSLIAADAQTAGRGRQGRYWHTQPGVSLAFSLVLKPPFPSEIGILPRLTALGSLAVRAALLDLGLPAEVKWPNDVLVNRRKVAGILAEAHWTGSNLQGVVIGIGINVSAGSVPSGDLNFPATSLEAERGEPLDRWKFLHSVLAHLLVLRRDLGSPQFLQVWESALAFKGEWVLLDPGDGTLQEGKLAGLAEDGSLLLEDRSGALTSARFGDIHLRAS